MKRQFFLFCAVLLASSMFAAQYYVAGNGTTGSVWCDGKNWQANGSAMTMNGNTGTITFNNVPIGSYQFKITTGTWSTNYGFNNYDVSCSNLYATSSGGDGNVAFSIQQAQNITITFNGSKICLTGSKGNDTPDQSQYGKYGVPSEYEGVMLQAFYWDSHNKTKYSNTKWTTLSTMASQIGQNFDLVWFPPSGNGGGVGYYTKTYSNQTSAWGSRTQLQNLINTLHSHNTKVLADIVINHRQSSSGWAKSFTSEDFGTYGTFQINSTHICSNDEAATSTSSDSRNLQYGNPDTGDNDGSCRDLDHTSTYVQNYLKAYVQWMIHDIGYDGFRYDMTKGYLGTYLSMYNKAAQPFFSVSEYWDGNANNLKNYVNSAEQNTTTFDFSLKYKLNSTIGKGTFSGLANAGMRSVGMEKYAVTFIDNHDTFERSDNQSDEFSGYNINLTDKKDRILQANAYILMMPGTPCVFWPHWYTFQNEINTLIAIRKSVGIHSESKVYNETASANAYSAQIVGHRGSIILRMGSGRDTTTPVGYTRVFSQSSIDIYSTNLLSTLEEVTHTSNNAQKVIENGQLFILHNGNKYTSTGQLVQ